MNDEMSNHLLGLQLPTDPRWVNVAQMNIEEILVDHAYCEQKAASSCISLIILFPEKTEMVEMITPVVAEEWNHFERVLEQGKPERMNMSFSFKKWLEKEETEINN